MSKKIHTHNVLVTAIGGAGIGAQILKALRLSPLPYLIVGVDIQKISKGYAIVDFAYRVPRADHVDYVNCLINICQKHNIRAVFPGSEAEILILNQHLETFDSIGITVFINPSEVLDICLNKTKTMSFFKENKFIYPHYFDVQSAMDLQLIDIFPVVLKPTVGGGGSNNVFIAQNKEQLQSFGKILFSIGSHFIAQEYIGTPESEYTVGILTSMEGKLINSIAMKRDLSLKLSQHLSVPNLTNRSELGANLVISSGISQGEINDFPEIQRYCEKVTLALGAKGALNIQCRIMNGKVYIFEINPRFSGTSSMRAMMGYNEPDILFRQHILGEKFEPYFSYQKGYIVRGLSESVFTTEYSVSDGRCL